MTDQAYARVDGSSGMVGTLSVGTPPRRVPGTMLIHFAAMHDLAVGSGRRPVIAAALDVLVQTGENLSGLNCYPCAPCLASAAGQADGPDECAHLGAGCDMAH